MVSARERLHACVHFILVHVAESVQQRPLGSHFSGDRRGVAEGSHLSPVRVVAQVLSQVLCVQVLSGKFVAPHLLPAKGASINSQLWPR